MNMPTKEEIEAGAAAGTADAGAANAGGEKKTEPKPAEAAAGGAAAGTTTTTKAAPGTAAAAEGGETTEDVLKLSKAALKERMERHTAKELKALFGTDEPEKIRAILKERQDLLDKEETRRQETLTKEQKLEERATQAESRAQAAEARARQVSQRREFEKYDGRFAKIAAKVIDEDYVDAELTNFAKHMVKSHSKKELARMKTEEWTKELGTFLDGRVKAKPKLAKDYEDKAREALAKEIKANGGKVPVTNGGKGHRPDAKAADQSGPQTFAPGKANSIPEKDVRAKLKAAGISYR
jgi:hypothetical protein